MLTKEKIDRQLSCQTAATTPFLKVGDVHHSNKKTISFSTQDLIREQLDNLTSMVYHMSMEKERNNRPFKHQVHEKKNQQNFRDRNGSYSRDRANYRQNFRPNYRRQSQDRLGNRRGNYACQNYGTRGDIRDRGRERANYRRDISNDRNNSRDRNRSRTRERGLTPRRHARRYHSPNSNVGTRNRSTSRVTMNRDRIRCYKCRVHDHFSNECPNSVTDDLDGYDRAALQSITAEAEIHKNFDATRLNEGQDYLNL